MTKDQLKRLSVHLLRVSLAVFLVLFLSLISQGCLSISTKKKIRSSVWLNNSPLPAQICTTEAKDYGFYRRLNQGGFEFVSFCNPVAPEWIAIHYRDLEEILNETLPKPIANQVLGQVRLAKNSPR